MHINRVGIRRILKKTLLFGPFWPLLPEDGEIGPLTKKIRLRLFCIYGRAKHWKVVIITETHTLNHSHTMHARTHSHTLTHTHTHTHTPLHLSSIFFTVFYGVTDGQTNYITWLSRPLSPCWGPELGGKTSWRQGVLNIPTHHPSVVVTSRGYLRASY